jgi:hypothetical protein
MGSRWRVLAGGLRGRLPRGSGGRQISGIVQTIVGTGEDGKDRISGLTYTAVFGHTHPLDGQSIDFGDYGIPRDEVPSPWRELLEEPLRPPVEPFTFNLDSPGPGRPVDFPHGALLSSTDDRFN